MSTRKIQLTIAIVIVGLLTVGVLFIRHSFRPPQDVASAPPVPVPMPDRETAGSVEIGSAGGQVEGYAAVMESGRLLASDSDDVGGEETDDEEVEWSEAECLKFTDHLRRLASKSKNAGGPKGGAGAHIQEMASWCERRDVSPSFIRCALTKSSNEELIECAGVGADELSDSAPDDADPPPEISQ